MYTQRLDVDALEHPPEPVRRRPCLRQCEAGPGRARPTCGRATAAAGASHFTRCTPAGPTRPACRSRCRVSNASCDPLLRIAEQGADTMAWLAAAPEARERTERSGSIAGRRATTVFPWTRTPDGEAERLWNWCVDACRQPLRRPRRREDRDRRDRRLRARRRPRPAPRSRRDRLRVRRARRRPRPHGRRRGRWRHARGRHGLHRLQRAQLPGFRALLATRRRDPADGDELQRHRSAAPGSSTVARTSTRCSPSGATFAIRRSCACSPTSCGSTGPPPARRGRATLARTLIGCPEPAASTPDADESLGRRSCGAAGTRDRSSTQFLVPFGASIWSADPSTFTRFPMRSYARFMHNHGLLGLPGRPQWRTVTGGSRRYVDALIAPVRRSHPARRRRCTRSSARRRPAARTVEVLTDRGPELFDRVIIATHSDQALRMLADPSPPSGRCSARSATSATSATLHTDARLLPRSRAARASWNYADRSGRSPRPPSRTG